MGVLYELHGRITCGHQQDVAADLVVALGAAAGLEAEQGVTADSVVVQGVVADLVVVQGVVADLVVEQGGTVAAGLVVAQGVTAVKVVAEAQSASLRGGEVGQAVVSRQEVDSEGHAVELGGGPGAWPGLFPRGS